MKKGYITFICVTIILALTLTGCGKKNAPVLSEQPVEKPVAVSVAKVQRTEIESVSTLSGKVKPVQEINIMPKIPGKVSAVYFDVGQKVNAGDVLFCLEDSDIRLQVNQAEAALNIAKSALDRTKGGAVEQQLSQLKAALVSAETGYNDAKLGYDRSKLLYETGAISKQALEAAETRLKVAEEQFNSAKKSYELT